MSRLFSPPLWPVVTLLASAMMLASAHAFEHLGELPPCPLCLRQREVYWAAIVVGLLGLGLMRIRAPESRIGYVTSVVLGLVFLTGAIIAGYHAGVEWGVFPPPATCTAAPVPGELGGPINIDRSFNVVPCDKAAWRMFGISMAGYNVLASVGLAAISFWVATRPRTGQALTTLQDA